MLPNNLERFLSFTVRDVMFVNLYNFLFLWMSLDRLAKDVLTEVHNLYLKADRLFLCKVFEKFRSKALKTFRLDPAHYISLPRYSWSIWKIRCPDGICQVLKRYGKVNNSYL